MSDKIKRLGELVKIREELRKKGKKVVTTNGSFDIMHAGHVYFLRLAKKQGDVLIVGLNSDKSIHEYKSKDRPIIPEKHRAEMMAAMEMVDYVFLFDETIPNAYLEKLKPDVHANAASYGKDCVEAELVKRNGGRLFLVPDDKNGLSTTEIIKKIIKVYGKKGE